MPTYPYELSRDGLSGGVLSKLTIDRKAKLKNVELIRASHQKMAEAALYAVKKWTYSQPAKKDGEPIEIALYQLIKFQVEGKTLAPWQWQMTPEPAFPIFILTGSFIVMP